MRNISTCRISRKPIPRRRLRLGAARSIRNPLRKNRARRGEGSAQLSRGEERGRRADTHSGRHHHCRRKEVAKLEGDSTGFADPPVSVQIAELDPSNSHPEVVVSFYTGGAHCCSDTSVVTSGPDE